jgi:Xaa-Pro dipeptidase
MLEVTHSRARQKRLLELMQQRRLDAAVVGLPHHVYYFSAVQPHWLQTWAFVLLADGEARLMCGTAPQKSAADHVVPFEATYLGTQRQEQPEVVAAEWVEFLNNRGAKRIGIDTSPLGAQLALKMRERHVEAIDEALWQMRRVKDPDELALMEKAVQCASAMYRRAREVVAPGVSEVEVFAEVQAAAVREAGEPLTALLGNDYVAGRGGGLPRSDRKADKGQIFILDVGPCYRGYFGDVCRGFVVGGKPSQPQIAAAEALKHALHIVERRARPGVNCRDIYVEVDEYLRAHPAAQFGHHLGHGVGLQPHEFPHLNPHWNDVLMEGEVFTVEPGLYAPQLRGGLRIENEYVVTKTGVRNLLDTPTELL